MSDRRAKAEEARLSSNFSLVLRNSSLPDNPRKLYGRPYLFSFALDGHGIYREDLSGTIVGSAFGWHDGLEVNGTIELQISNPDSLPYGKIRCIKQIQDGRWRIVFHDPSLNRDGNSCYEGRLVLL